MSVSGTNLELSLIFDLQHLCFLHALDKILLSSVVMVLPFHPGRAPIFRTKYVTKKAMNVWQKYKIRTGFEPGPPG